MKCGRKRQEERSVDSYFVLIISAQLRPKKLKKRKKSTPCMFITSSYCMFYTECTGLRLYAGSTKRTNASWTTPWGLCEQDVHKDPYGWSSLNSKVNDFRDFSVCLSVSLSVCLSVSVCLSHTHTHTHSVSLSLPLSVCLSHTHIHTHTHTPPSTSNSANTSC